MRFYVQIVSVGIQCNAFTRLCFIWLSQQLPFDNMNVHLKICHVGWMFQIPGFRGFEETEQVTNPDKILKLIFLSIAPGTFILAEKQLFNKWNSF